MSQSDLGNPIVRAAVRAILTGGTIAATFSVAKAQVTPAGAPPAENPAVTEVVVTGSRIAVPNETSISPVTFITAETLQQTGVTRVEDLLNQMPQVFADQNSNVSNGSDGTASINLRGLNAKRTLVLVNGDRLGPGDPGTGGQSDINIIPVELVDSIEILTGGSSATYGADAVAGVVNFKLNDHFEGVKLVADAGVYQHDNSDISGVIEAQEASGFTQAPSTVWPGAQRSLAFIAGMNSANGNGNATLYITYRNVLPVTQAKYSWSACTLGSGFLGTGTNATGGKFVCAGSITSDPAHLLNLSTGVLETIGPNYTTVPFAPSSLFNYGPYNYYQRQDERYTSGAFLHYTFNDHATVYSNTMWMDDYTQSQLAPSADFATNAPVPCTNPFLAANVDAYDFLGCTAAAGATTNPNVLILRRNAEGGPRQQQLDHGAIREVIGIKGAIDNVWTYDATWTYNQVSLSSTTNNFLLTPLINNALNVTGTVANPSCTIGPPCVPWNIFTAAPVSQAASNYLVGPSLLSGRISQQDVQSNVTGDLGKYGIQLPTANSGLQVNVGAEYRDVKSAFEPDYVSVEALASGSSATTPVSGGFFVWEGFAEARMPLVQDKPGFQTLNLEAGYRYSSYNLGFNTNTYKIGLDWAPVQDVRLRASFDRAVRAPNIIELFTPTAIGLDGTYSADPCSGAVPVYTLAQCEKTGVTPAEYGHIVANPAAQYNGLLGGNPALLPETALTGSFGIGWTPSFLPGLRAQVDYYNIKIEKVIEPIGGGVILTQCATNDLYCNLIHRGPGGTLWATNAGFITDTNENVGQLQEKGIDVDISYHFKIGSAGNMVAALQGTYMDSYIVTPLEGDSSTSYNCAGLYGPICSGSSAAGVPAPRWRQRFSATWQSPWKGFDMTLAWRYIGPVRLELLSTNPNLAAPPGATIENGGISNTDAYLASYSYFDLTAKIDLAEKVQLRLGCNNILDKAPPLIGSTDLPGTTGNGNTFPGYYDSLGRFLFAELNAQF